MGDEGSVNQGYLLDEFHSKIKRALPTDAENFAALVKCLSES